MRRTHCLLVTLLALPTVALLPAGGATEPVLLPAARLPVGSFAHGAVWTGSQVLLLGGADMVCYCELDLVLRYDPATREATDTGLRLPDAAAWVSAAWTGTEAVVATARGAVHFDAAIGASEFVPFDGYRNTARAAWDGERMHLFDADWSGRTMVYDPKARTDVLLPTRAPVEIGGAAAAWDGEHVYLFGGTDFRFFYDHIVRYDVSEDRFEVLPARLPSPRAFGSAVWTGSEFLVVGGLLAHGVDGAATLFAYSDEIVAFDPATGSVEVLPSRLLSGVADASAVWTGDELVVLGGTCTCPPHRLVPSDPLDAPNELFSSAMQTDAVVSFRP